MANTIYIDKWFERANVDYYTMFIKSWIPYNAWYNKVIAPMSGNKDVDCIDYICNNSNKYKDKIASLLRGDMVENQIFKYELAQLHLSLLAHTLPSADNPISFSTISIKDVSHPIEKTIYRNYFYKVERIGATFGQFEYDIRVEDNVTHTPKYVYHLRKNDSFDNVEKDVNYQQLSYAVKNKIKVCYQKVNPNFPTDVVLQPVVKDKTYTAPRNSILLSESNRIYFIDNTDIIAKVLIRIIYRLRCEMFHGSIEPSEANEEVFAHLYKIQYILIKELV